MSIDHKQDDTPSAHVAHGQPDDVSGSTHSFQELRAAEQRQRVLTIMTGVVDPSKVDNWVSLHAAINVLVSHYQTAASDLGDDAEATLDECLASGEEIAKLTDEESLVLMGEALTAVGSSDTTIRERLAAAPEHWLPQITPEFSATIMRLPDDADHASSIDTRLNYIRARKQVANVLEPLLSTSPFNLNGVGDLRRLARIADTIKSVGTDHLSSDPSPAIVSTKIANERVRDRFHPIVSAKFPKTIDVAEFDKQAASDAHDALLLTGIKRLRARFSTIKVSLDHMKSIGYVGKMHDAQKALFSLLQYREAVERIRVADEGLSAAHKINSEGVNLILNSLAELGENSDEIIFWIKNLTLENVDALAKTGEALVFVQSMPDEASLYQDASADEEASLAKALDILTNLAVDDENRELLLWLCSMSQLLTNAGVSSDLVNLGQRIEALEAVVGSTITADIKKDDGPNGSLLQYRRQAVLRYNLGLSLNDQLAKCPPGISTDLLRGHICETAQALAAVDSQKISKAAALAPAPDNAK